MVTAITVSVTVGIAQAFLLYLAVASVMKTRLKNALLFFFGKTALYGVSVLLIMTAGREQLIPCALSFGAAHAVSTFALAAVSIKKNGKNRKSE